MLCWGVGDALRGDWGGLWGVLEGKRRAIGVDI